MLGGEGMASSLGRDSQSSAAEKAACIASLKHIESAAQRIQEAQRGRASRADSVHAARAGNDSCAGSSGVRGSASHVSSRASQYVPGQDDLASTDVSEGSELPEEDDGSISPVVTHPIQPWRLGMSIRDSGAAAPLRASEAFAV